MENTKRARKEKSGIRPSGGTYVESKDLLSGLERVREAARRASGIRFTSLGVSEEGEWSKTVVGTPQGAVISPVLANIYLHYVLGLWVEKSILHPYPNQRLCVTT